MAKESYIWNPKSNEWDLNLEYDNEETKEISRLEGQMIDAGEDACIQFEKSWNEIFLLRATCESTEYDPITILESGINFARA